jgi:hypothetical protein
MNVFFRGCRSSYISILGGARNRVGRDFLRFVRSSAHLVGLDVSNSLSPGSASLMKDVVRMLKGKDAFIAIIAANDEAHNFGPDMIPFVKGCASLPRLARLVISGNEIGNAGIDAIIDLLRKSPTVKEVCFNGC